VAKAFVLQHLDRALEDAKLSPQEEAGLASAAKALGVTIDYDAASQAAIDHARKVWQIEHAQLTPVPAPINLQRSEVCYDWTEAEALVDCV
jgi:hypothetical protein